MPSPYFLDRDETLVLRTARKTHRCCKGGGDRTHGSPDCTGTVQPGERYVEYLGESPAYSSSYAYCLPCHRKVWGEMAPLPEGL